MKWGDGEVNNYLNCDVYLRWWKSILRKVIRRFKLNKEELLQNLRFSVVSEKNCYKASDGFSAVELRVKIESLDSEENFDLVLRESAK